MSFTQTPPTREDDQEQSDIRAFSKQDKMTEKYSFYVKLSFAETVI
jgi:hypothetical protein